jgi:hypothetical protein
MLPPTWPVSTRPVVAGFQLSGDTRYSVLLVVAEDIFLTMTNATLAQQALLGLLSSLALEFL